MVATLTAFWLDNLLEQPIRMARVDPTPRNDAVPDPTGSVE